MTARKRVVERYIEGFRTGDHETILGCLTDDVEEGDVVVAEGSVQAPLKAGGNIDALFCDVFHFRGDRICRLVTYQVDRRPGALAADVSTFDPSRSVDVLE